MSNTTSPTSILELLTHPNPSVTHEEPANNKNTTNWNYFIPVKLTEWKEFRDLDILKKSFKGALFLAAQQPGRQLPHYPIIYRDTDCTLEVERDTEKLFHVWNERVVTMALRSVQEEFGAAIWRKGKKPLGDALVDPPARRKGNREQPKRGCSKQKPTKKHSLQRLNSDSGSSKPMTPPLEPGPVPISQERFPKEYKVATKWHSQWLKQSGIIDEKGDWQTEKSAHKHAWPVRQAFTYCIRDMCRYGCILTCQEAFIFRIKPSGEKMSEENDTEDLKTRLKYDGMMEYTSIPWDNHSSGDIETLETWTINLALWFMHTLVGNNYQAQSEYRSLEAEDIREAPILRTEPSASSNLVSEAPNDLQQVVPEDEHGASDSDDSDKTQPLWETPSKKRGRDDDLEERYLLSFDTPSKRQVRRGPSSLYE